MSDVAITNIETLIFIVSGYIAMCCIAVWQYRLRHYIRFSNNFNSLLALHTILSVGVLIGR